MTPRTDLSRDLPPDVPTDADLRVLLSREVPRHLDGFWDGVDASLRGGTLSPLHRASRRRAWLVPAAAAAAVLAVVGGTVAGRAFAGQDPSPAGLPAAPPSPAPSVPEDPFLIEDWDDLEPGTEYSLAAPVPEAFRMPALVPGTVSSTSYWVDDAGHHALVLSAESDVREGEDGRSRVGVVAAHATLATRGPSGWSVTARVSHAVDPACDRPTASAARPFPDWAAGEYDSDGDGVVDRPPVPDADGDGWAEFTVALVTRCRGGDLDVRHVTMDGSDAYELRGTVVADYQVLEGMGGGELTTTPPAPPMAVPEPAAWPEAVYERALASYNSWFADID